MTVYREGNSQSAMSPRDPHLQRLLALCEGIIAASGDARAEAAGARVFGRLAQRVGARGAGAARRLPACQHNLEAALAGASVACAPLPALGRAFAALEGGLHWYRRKTADPLDQPFFDGHANAMLVGPDGLEMRDDVMVGVTAMAPQITYPDHDHPPEEVYVALSPGEWRNAAMDWTAPGPGGIIYNPPGILHAMRSHADPFLALWFLPLD